jgi:hypothetical protein
MVDPTGGVTAVAVANLNKWDLDLSTAKIDVTAFGDTNNQYVQGLPDFKGTLAGFWDSAEIKLFTIAMGTVACFLKLLPSSLETTVFFSGKAWLDAKVSVDAKGAVTIGGSFVAAGPWTMAP